MDFRTRDENKLPLVTIGVLSCNHADYVLDALNSIYFQTYPHIELFIVDDCSTDNSIALFEQWIVGKNVFCTFIRHDKHKGKNAAINAVLQRSHGKFLAWFAADNIMNPDRIQQQVNCMLDAKEDVAVCYSDASLINEKGEDKGLYSDRNHSPFLEGSVFAEFFKGEFFMAAPTLLFRRSAIDKTGGYDTNLTAVNYDMWMRLLPVCKVKLSPYVGVKYRTKENGALNEDRQWLEQCYHKDRIIIYLRLVHFLKAMNKYEDIRLSAVGRINDHLFCLQRMQSEYFGQMFRYLIARSFYQIRYSRLFKNKLRNIITPRKQVPV